MGFLFLALIGLGVFAATRAGQAAGGMGGGPPAVDPAASNPALGGPRTQTINGVVALTAPWAAVAVMRLARYAPGRQDAPRALQGVLRFFDNFRAPGAPTPAQIQARSVLQWIHDENAKGNAILVSTRLVTGRFTEDTNENAAKANPFLPSEIMIYSVQLPFLQTAATPGTGLAVLSAVPGTL